MEMNVPCIANLVFVSKRPWLLGGTFSGERRWLQVVDLFVGKVIICKAGGFFCLQKQKWTWKQLKTLIGENILKSCFHSYIMNLPKVTFSNGSKGKLPLLFTINVEPAWGIILIRGDTSKPNYWSLRNTLLSYRLGCSIFAFGASVRRY